MPVSKEERDRRVAAGQCEQCGKEPVEGNTRKGVLCKRKNQGTRQQAKDKKISQRICIIEGCHSPAKEDCVMCQECIDISSAGTSRNYAKKKAMPGCCPYCPAGTPCEPGFKACRIHLDKVNIGGKENYRKCKEAGLCYFCGRPKAPAIKGKAYCVAHRDANNARSKQRNKLRRAKVLKHYGLKCACCAFSVECSLQIDHIKGGGRKHLKVIGRSGLYKWLIDNNFPPDFQTLCALCNWMKKQFGFCPHCTWPPEELELLRSTNRKLTEMQKSRGVVAA